MSKHFLQMIATILCALLLGGCGAADQGTISMDQYPVAVPRTEEESEEEADEEPLTDVTGMREELYVVVSIDTEERLIRLALPDSLRTVQYGYTRGTQILDDHGQFMSAARLAPGRVVTISELDDQAQLTMI